MTDRPGLDMVNKSNAVVTALEQRGQMTAVEVAELVGEPVSSTYRLLTSLTTMGWVDRGSRRGSYRLGLFFMGVGGLVEAGVDLRERALPAMRELVGSTRATTYLCVRRGVRAVCIERLDGRDVRSLAMELGDSLPLYLGAGPTALLAFLPPGERAAVVEELEAEPRLWPDAPRREEVERAVRSIRARGYSVSDEDVTTGVAAIGAPVLNHRREIEAAVSVSGLRDQVLGDRQGTVDAVLAAAREISRSLGCPGDPVPA